MAKLFDGLTPAEFAAEVDAFVEGYRHPTLGVPIGSVVYQPMLELLAELRAHDFTIGLVTGGGTEFVRRVGPMLLRRRAGAGRRDADRLRVRP